MPPMKPWIPTETLQSVADLDFGDELTNGLAQIQFTSALPAALDGLKSIAASFKPLPIVVSDRPDAMQYREQQDQPVPPTVEMPTPPQPSAAIPGPDLSPDSGTPVRSAAEMSADMPATAGEPGGPPLSNGPVWEPSKGQAPSGNIDNSSRQAFVRTAWPHMLAAAGGNRDAAEMMLAAAISENGDVGKGGGFIGNNFFGIKGVGPAGSVEADTWEDYGNGRTNIRDKFKAYNNPAEGFGGFFDFLRENSRYAPALQRYQQTGDAVQLFRDVNAAGYATDKAWADKVANIRDNQVAPVTRTLNAGASPPAASLPSAPTAATGAPEPSPSVGATAQIGSGPESYANLLTMGKEQGDDEYDPRDADSGPRESGYVLPPAPETLPGDGGAAPQPLQSTGSSNAYPQSSSGSNGALAGLPEEEELAPRPLDERPVEPEGRFLDLSIPSPPGWQAIVDGAGTVVDWVKERVEDVAEGARQAGTAVSNTLTYGRPEDGPQPVQAMPGEPDYRPSQTYFEAADARAQQRAGQSLGERAAQSVTDLTRRLPAPFGEGNQEAGDMLESSVRQAGMPIVQPVREAARAGASAIEQTTGAPEGSVRQAAEDVSNFFAPVSPMVGMVRNAGGMADDAARAAGSAARRLRGRPIPGQQPIELTQAEEVSRLRLDKFPEEVRADIEAAAKGLNFAHEQRRGVLPDAVVQQLAGDDLRSVDQIIKGGRAGRAYNAEETVAVRNAVASQANVVRELSEEIAQARTAGHAPELLVARRAAEATKLDGLVKLAEGARAEAGRTLRAYRQQARLIDLNPNEAVERIYKKLGGRDAAQEAVDQYTQMVQDGANPIQLAKFWAGVEAGKITGSDLFSLYRRFNMLSGPRTVEVNALSGAVNLGYEVLASALGTAARGRAGEAVAELAAPFKAGSRAFKNMAETMWHGVSTEQAARGDIPRTLSSRTENPVAKGALTVMEIPDRFNAGVDQFFRTMTEDWAATKLAAKQAREANLTPRSPEWAEAVAKNLEVIRDDPSKFPEIQKMAERVTFSEEPGGLVKWLEEGKRKSPNIVGYILPFIRTPANIASRAVDLSPLGPARTTIEASTGLGRGSENLSGRVRDNVLGTAATLWAYDQAQKGNITGAGPNDPEKTAELRATGWQPYSVRVGDQYWSYANFAPFSLALSMGAAASEAQKYAKDGKTDTLSMLSDGAGRTAKVVTDMTVLAGIGAVIKSIDDPDRYGGRWLSQALQQLIPAGSALNTVGQVMDPNMRRAERDTFANQVTGDVMARIPPNPITPDRMDVPVAQDPLGRPVPNEQTGFGALNPFRPTTERPDPSLQPFIEAGVDIGKPKETLTVRAGTAPISLTPAEQRRWNELRGEQIQRVAPQISRAESYRAAGKQGQEIVLKRLLNQATEAADRLILSEMGNGEVRRRMTEALQKKAG